MKTLIGGMGRSGQALAVFLERAGIGFDVFDEGSKATTLGGGQIFTRAEDIPWITYDRCVLSPGIPLDHPLVVNAQQNGLDVISEIEFAFQNCTGPVIAVTGSNGKSSTVTMLESIFQQTGRSVHLCGNIGKPFTQAVYENPEALFVVEVSSFQLETIRSFKPRVAILLNVTPDHIDRHGSFEVYEQAKLRIFENQGNGDLALVSAHYSKKLPGNAQLMLVPNVEVGPRLKLQSGAELEIDNPVLSSPHQKSNALFASLAAENMGVDAKVIERGLNQFQGLVHRMEIVGHILGRTWINDSKATNTDSTQVAINAMTGPFILILGGKNKDADFSVLDFSKNLPREIIIYGAASDDISRALSSFQPTVQKVFRDACYRAWSSSREGDAILLSPGCASFDQFRNFEHRGDVFKEIFLKIQNETEMSP